MSAACGGWLLEGWMREGVFSDFHWLWGDRDYVGPMRDAWLGVSLLRT